MWFNNVLVYRYELPKGTELNSALLDEILKPCPPHARFTHGWLPACGDELAQEASGISMINFGREERILPRSVINRVLEEKIKRIELEHNRTVKRSERSQLAEDIEFELLPKSFSIQKKLPAFLDALSGYLFINSASNNQASQLLALLRKSVTGIQIEPVTVENNLSMLFASWISDPSAIPANFELASDCLLFSPDNEKKKINCKGYELPSEEVLSLLNQGLVAAEISLVWNERVQFTLTQDMVLKRLKCTDYLLDDFNETRQLEEDYQQQDAALTLLAGELRGLLGDLLKKLKTSKTCIDDIVKAPVEEPTVAV